MSSLTRSTSRCLRLPFLSFIGAMTLSFALGGTPTRLLVDLSDRPAALGLSAFDLCILRVDAKVDLEAAHALGNKVLARLPLFEVPDNSPAAALATQLGVPLLAGREPGMVRLDATHPRWAHVVVHELVETAAERGFDGVVLSELETISHDAERAAVLRVLPLLKSSYPDKKLFMEGGFTLLHEARRQLDGIVFIEETAPTAEDTLRTERKIREATRQGVQAYVVGFENPEQPTHISERAARIVELGGVPFFTTREMHGANMGPLQEITRRVLVLHTGEAQRSYTARVLHGSLEWLGYQLIYQTADQEGSWVPDHQTLSGVILDPSLQLSAERQHSLADLVSTLVAQRVPLLLTSQPWSQTEDWAQVSTTLGLSGSGKAVTSTDGKASLQKVETSLLMNPGPATARTSGLRDIRSTGNGAEILLSLRVGDVDHTQIALTPWGGLWLDPLAAEAGPQMNPLPFFERLFATGTPTPVADTTSLDGQRLLVTHISSEGYTELSDLPGLPLAAEAMLEKVLSRYSLPMTVALSEGDVRGWSPGSTPLQAPRLQEAARAIFALRQVEPGSATLSRPSLWKGKEPTGGQLNASATEKQPNLGREIAGSLAFLHRHFLSHGSAMRVLSWPQGSFPSPESAAFTQELKVENVAMQSLDTLPGRTPALAARSWGRAQSFTTLLPQPRSPRPLDAASFIAESQRLGQNRWLSPVQLSLSFQDATTTTALSQVETALDWCASQPFQAISAGSYARLMRDAAQTRIFQTGPDRWIIVNEGYARTLRLPATCGVPDLPRCTGVSGFIRQGDQLYIHTLGLRRTELVMTPEPTRDYLRLASSSGSVRYLEAGSSRALLQVFNTRPVEMTFEGMKPGSICQMTTGGAPEYLMADTAGRIEFTVPSQAIVQLHILPNKTAAMR